MGDAKIPQTAFGRASRLLLSGAKIAAREVSGRVAAKIAKTGEGTPLATKIRQTQELVDALSQLKGAAMKAGQLISLEFSDLLPPEVLDILRKLHDSGTTMPFDQVRYILGRELGRERLSDLHDLSPEPIAAASIGQVHKATLHGRPVVVKVQFPGVAESIDADLKALRRVAQVALQIQGKDISLDAFFSELKESFKKEADYLLEADNVNRYRAKMRNPRFVVPEAIPSYSTSRVLTLTFEEGLRISDWMKSRPDRETIMDFAVLITDLIIDEFYVNGLVQTDPNFGNFLFRPSTRQLVLLDFGATNEYEPAFRQEIRQLTLCALEGDEKRLVEMTLDMGLLDRREPEEVLAIFCEMIRKVMELFHPDCQPFRFRDDQYLRDIREISMRFVSKIKYSTPARQIVFLNRKLGGMYHLLKDLDVEMDMQPILARALEAPLGPL
jgi:aarF domain-containing kinase